MYLNPRSCPWYSFEISPFLTIDTKGLLPIPLFGNAYSTPLTWPANRDLSSWLPLYPPPVFTLSNKPLLMSMRMPFFILLRGATKHCPSSAKPQTMKTAPYFKACTTTSSWLPSITGPPPPLLNLCPQLLKFLTHTESTPVHFTESLPFQNPSFRDYWHWPPPIMPTV